MADPVTLSAMAIGSMVATGAGAVIAGQGASYTGQAQSNQYQYLAGVARANQTIEEGNAEYERKSGEVEAQESGLKTEAERADVTTHEAAGNIDVTRGTPTDIKSSITEIGQQNEAIIRANAAKRAYGADIKAFEQGTQAGLYDTSAVTSKTAGDINALSSYVGGAGNVASKWFQYGTSFGTTGSPSKSGGNVSQDFG